MGIIIRVPKETGRKPPIAIQNAARRLAEREGVSVRHMEVTLLEGLENGHLSERKQAQSIREEAEKEREKHRYDRRK